MKKLSICTLSVLLLSAISIANAQNPTEKKEMPATKTDMDMSDCPMMKDHGPNAKKEEHFEKMMANGTKAMGFSQTATTHHFLLMSDGGAIQVEVNETADEANRSAIRSHLSEIAKQFANGIFTTPFAVHGKMPDGAKAMDELKSEIKYSYEETPNGGRVRISTADPRAREAIYQFLRFQINEHKTGDPLEPSK